MITASFKRFLVVGTVNFLITYTTFLLFLLFFHYQLALVLNYILGFFIQYFSNQIFVFQENISIKKMIKYPISLIVTYILNTLLISLFVEVFQFSPAVSQFLIVLILVPISYTINKKILK